MADGESKVEMSAEDERRRRSREAGEAHKKWLKDNYLADFGWVIGGKMTPEQRARAEEVVNKRVLERLKTESTMMRDPLTGAFTFGEINARLAQSHREAMKSGAKLGAILLDLDHFKQVNDMIGHLEGNETLKTFVMIVNSIMREDDSLGYLGRWGGEEFLVVLPLADEDTLKKLATEIGNSVSRDLARESGLVEKGRNLQTVSMAVAMVDSGEDLNTFFGRLDQSLYKAKNEGRNRVVFQKPNGEYEAVPFVGLTREDGSVQSSS